MKLPEPRLELPNEVRRNERILLPTPILNTAPRTLTDRQTDRQYNQSYPIQEVQNYKYKNICNNQKHTPCSMLYTVTLATGCARLPHSFTYLKPRTRTHTHPHRNTDNYTHTHPNKHRLRVPRTHTHTHTHTFSHTRKHSQSDTQKGSHIR